MRLIEIIGGPLDGEKIPVHEEAEGILIVGFDGTVMPLEIEEGDKVTWGATI
jgi:hypothetical protein